MTKTYLDECIERAEKASKGPWERDRIDVVLTNDVNTPVSDCYTDEDAEFIANARQDVPELAKKLNMACKYLREISKVLGKEVSDFADELEAAPEEKR